MALFKGWPKWINHLRGAGNERDWHGTGRLSWHWATVVRSWWTRLINAESLLSIEHAITRDPGWITKYFIGKFYPPSASDMHTNSFEVFHPFDNRRSLQIDVESIDHCTAIPFHSNFLWVELRVNLDCIIYISCQYSFSWMDFNQDRYEKLKIGVGISTRESAAGKRQLLVLIDWINWISIDERL